MPHSAIDYETPELTQRLPLSGALFLWAGLYALACIPAVFLFEAMRWPERFIHSSQFVACLLCFGAAITHLFTARHSRPRMFGIPTRGLAIVAAMLAGGYLLLVLIVLATLDFSSMD
jgi:hypothetical protein